jgi:hypothetical protein
MKKLILFTLFLLCGPLAYASTLTDSLPPITVVEDTTVAALAEKPGNLATNSKWYAHLFRFERSLGS